MSDEELDEIREVIGRLWAELDALRAGLLVLTRARSDADRAFLENALVRVLELPQPSPAVKGLLVEMLARVRGQDFSPP